MKKIKLEAFLGSLGGTEGSYPFGPDAYVFKVMGKMFALVSQNDSPARVTLKCNPSDAQALVEQFESIIPGYYMNKKHWITISLEGGVPDGLLMDLVEGSYKLIAGKLKKADKLELEQL